MRQIATLFALSAVVLLGSSSANADVTPNKIHHVICKTGVTYAASLKALHEDLHDGSKGELKISDHPGYQYVFDKQSISFVPGTTEACIPVTLVKDMPPTP